MRKLIILVLLLVAAVMALNGWFQYQTNKPLLVEEAVHYTLPAGQSAILENPDRRDRSGQHVFCRVDLRAVGLW